MQVDLTQCPPAIVGKVLGISAARVGQLAAQGILPKVKRGRYDLAECVKGYLKHKLQVVEASDAATKGLMFQRSRLAKSKADQAEAEQQRESGEWVNVADVERTWLALAATFRTRCLAIPTKAATRWAASRTANEAEALMRAEIHQALSELSAERA